MHQLFLTYCNCKIIYFCYNLKNYLLLLNAQQLQGCYWSPRRIWQPKIFVIIMGSFGAFLKTILAIIVFMFITDQNTFLSKVFYWQIIFFLNEA